MKLRSIAACAFSAALLLSSSGTPAAFAEENSEAELNASFETESATAEAAVDSLTHEQLQTLDSPNTEYTEFTLYSGDLAIMRDAEEGDNQARYVSCAVRVHNPHYSRGAGGAIYKTGLKCSSAGVSKSVKVRLRGLLALRPASSSTATPGKQQKRATSDQTVTVTANTGKWTTYYTPRTGSNGGTGKGFWIATTTGQITSHATLKGKRTTSKTKVLFTDIRK